MTDFEERHAGTRVPPRLFDLPAAADPAAPADASPPRRKTARRREPGPGLALTWSCSNGCGATVSAEDRTCIPCARALHEARRLRVLAAWREHLAWRFEVGDCAYESALEEWGWFDWRPGVAAREAHVIELADAARRAARWRLASAVVACLRAVGLAREADSEAGGRRRRTAAPAWGMYSARRHGRPGPYIGDRPAEDPADGRPEALVDDEPAWRVTVDGRMAPMGWQYGGMPEELPLVTASEHFDFTDAADDPSLDWWVDENDGSLMADLWVCHYPRPVIQVPVGEHL